MLLTNNYFCLDIDSKVNNWFVINRLNNRLNDIESRSFPLFDDLQMHYDKKSVAVVKVISKTCFHLAINLR